MGVAILSSRTKWPRREGKPLTSFVLLVLVVLDPHLTSSKAQLVCRVPFFPAPVLCAVASVGTAGLLNVHARGLDAVLVSYYSAEGEKLRSSAWLSNRTLGTTLPLLAVFYALQRLYYRSDIKACYIASW
jgi:hypothetical protein